jgi:putative membrane protein
MDRFRQTPVCIIAAMRLLAHLVVALVTSAVALAVAALVLPGFDVSGLTFPVLVIEFALILVIARAALETIIDKNAHILSSFVGLIGAFVALLVTNAVSDGLTIDGADTWIFATLIVWGGMILADLLIGRALFRRITGKER